MNKTQEECKAARTHLEETIGMLTDREALIYDHGFADGCLSTLKEMKASVKEAANDLPR